MSQLVRRRRIVLADGALAPGTTGAVAPTCRVKTAVRTIEAIYQPARSKVRGRTSDAGRVTRRCSLHSSSSLRFVLCAFHFSALRALQLPHQRLTAEIRNTTVSVTGISN